MIARMRGLIFDLDGTLADNHSLIQEAFADAFGRFTGRNFSHAEIRALYGPDEEGMARRVAPTRWQDTLAAFFAFYGREAPQREVAFEGIRDLLEGLLAGGLRLGLVTGRGERGAKMTLSALRLNHYFNAAAFGSPSGSVKEGGLKTILNQWLLPAGSVAYVGDAATDMVAARRTGVLPLGAAWCSQADPEELIEAGALNVFRSPTALLEWVRVARGMGA
jgi:HAD superfamily hydrolase (TIGR01549 family)